MLPFHTIGPTPYEVAPRLVVPDDSRRVAIPRVAVGVISGLVGFLVFAPDFLHPASVDRGVNGVHDERGVPRTVITLPDPPVSSLDIIRLDLPLDQPPDRLCFLPGDMQVTGRVLMLGARTVDIWVSWFGAFRD